VSIIFRTVCEYFRPQYLTPGGAEINFLAELRLQNTDQINTDILGGFTERMGAPKMMKARRNIMRACKKTTAQKHQSRP